MSNALFAALGVLVPVHVFLRRLTAAPAQARLRPSRADEANKLPIVAVAEPVHRPRNRGTSRAGNRSHTPLRVVRVLETGQAAAHGGRLMISGRMADVCAELDRMAAREAALHASV